MSPTARRLLIGGPLLGLVAALATVVFVASMLTSGTQTETTTGPCVTRAIAGGRSVTLDAAQRENARIIIDTGRRQGIPTRGLVIAVATAMQESTLRNLHWGDRDSVGLFQQRPSSGWGSVGELTTPHIAATKFYNALERVSGWQSMSLTRAAQAVQRSAFPFAYAKWESMATTLVRAAVGGDGRLGCERQVDTVQAAGAVAVFLRVALAQQGKPYVFGAVGPGSFDCSGLIVFSWARAGYRMRIRTAAQMWRASTPIAPGREHPGDLLFGEFDSRVAGAGHVMIVVRPGLAVQAPSTGRTVQLTHYRAGVGGWRLGRLKASAFVRVPGAVAA